MYVNPFLAGVLSTLFIEIAIFALIGIVCAVKVSRNKKK